jgi:acetyl esterase
VDLWNDELEGSREKIRLEALEFVGQFPDSDPRTGTPQERAQLMRRAQAAMVLRSDKATDRLVDGPAGALLLREFRPARARAAMLHIHGGGWMTGEPALTDLLHEALCDHLDLAIVSVDYRLAPEHPYPAGPDDCEAAALWLIENSMGEYGTDRLLIGGESAGAHLSAVTLLRLRDRHHLADRIVGANLVFGAYDLTGTPSARGAGAEGSDILSPEGIAFMADQFLQGRGPAQRRESDVSPLYADLRGLPPALFTVGTADHLVDDTLFLASRWILAGNDAELLVYPDAPHGCIGLPTVLAHWWPRLEAFLAQFLSEPAARS